MRTFQKHKEHHIDFSTLSEAELVNLSNKWQEDAFIFELRLAGYMRNPEANQDKINDLWETGAKLWRRLRTLERWRVNRKNKKNNVVSTAK